MLTYAMKVTSDYIAAERTVLSVLDREKAEISMEMGYGIPAKGKKVIYRIGEGVTGSVVKNGRPLYISKIQQEQRFLNRIKSRLHTAEGIFPDGRCTNNKGRC